MSKGKRKLVILLCSVLIAIGVLFLDDEKKLSLVTSLGVMAIFAILNLNLLVSEESKEIIHKTNQKINKQSIFLDKKVNESSDSVVTSINNHSDRLAVLMEIHNQLLSEKEVHQEEDLLKVFLKIVEVRKLLSKRVQSFQNLNRSILETLRRFETEVVSGLVVTDGDEYERSRRLHEIVGSSDSHVYAVTFDNDEYLADFWSKVFAKEYIEANLDAVKRHGKVERIFIFNSKLIKDDDLGINEKISRNRLLRISKSLVQGGCKVYWIYKHDLTKELRENTTSFLVSDGTNSSESAGQCNGRNIRAYVHYDNQNVARALEERFLLLRQCSNEISIGEIQSIQASLGEK
ncbi:MAG: hypothetical protein F6J87_11120 [Spirulina sp. SIO3F2]|nr:hypothetical protein [Spirulina sp. SIO3F2]